jgi:hypothetical protein
MNRAGRALPAALAVAVVAAGGCAKKKKSPGDEVAAVAELAGLAAVPSDARVVIGADPARLAGSPLVARAMELMIAREPSLADRFSRLADACQIDWREDLDSVVLAQVPETPPLLVVTGQLVEAEVAACVQNVATAGGGTLAVEPVEGRTLYTITSENRTLHFAFGRKDTVVLSASRDLVVAGLGTGPKLLDDPEMKQLVGAADTEKPIWGAGVADAKLGQRLLRLTKGEVKNPPRAFRASIDPAGGLQAELVAVMASEDDAKALESHMSTTLELISLAAQAYGLGPLAAKITGTRDGADVTFGVSLSDAETKDLLSTVDSRAPVAQDAGPVPAGPARDAGAGD